MAIIQCSECGKEISDKADTCPYCGCKSKRTEWIEKAEALQDLGKTMTLFITVPIIVIVILVICGL